ncbi:hypothetical protein GGR51DRAFT_518890 [Nemania sp. FL0031]|nr:hypothetical protein GGR51DRAFT_518890 [Nemania sp. FL0031]
MGLERLLDMYAVLLPRYSTVSTVGLCVLFSLTNNSELHLVGSPNTFNKYVRAGLMLICLIHELGFFTIARGVMKKMLLVPFRISPRYQHASFGLPNNYLPSI